MFTISQKITNVFLKSCTISRGKRSSNKGKMIDDTESQVTSYSKRAFFNPSAKYRTDPTLPEGRMVNIDGDTIEREKNRNKASA